MIYTRPRKVEGKTTRTRLGCGSLYVTVNFDEGRAVEIFSHLGKSGSCTRTLLEAVGRLIGMALQHDVPQDTILKALTGYRCLNTAWEDGVKYDSCLQCVAEALGKEA